MTARGARAVYIDAAKVGAVLGWPTRRARRWLMRSGAGVKRAGRWQTTPTLLGREFPEVVERLIDIDADCDGEA